MILRSQSDAEWASAQVATLPARWCMSIMGEWERRRSSYRPEKLTGENDARRKANEALRDTVARLVSFALHEDLPLDADDEQVVSFAHESAEQGRIALMELVELQENGRNAIRAAGLSEVQALALEAQEQREKLSTICEKRGVTPAPAKYEDVYAVRRMTAPRWWTLQARRAQARAVESAAIELGLVNRSKDCYVSNESLESRARQNDRNRAALEATIAKNLETQQEFTLAELAAKGTANKAIRRAELMTRIAGFERVAIARGDAGLFLTITCPSKMHRFTTRGGKVRQNTNYDGTKPNDAQKYLSGVWARIRAALHRNGMAVYGFRIAEPQHDGTPHWHLLLFYAPENDSKIRATIRRYALQMDGDEAGAQEKRCDFKTMDPSIGTAAAYIAKYVAKNIDGYRLEKDLIGNDALETSARVEAWATRWRIRQFQQVGGPPVTVWRELRRVQSIPSDAPAHVVKAHNAVNKVAVIEGRENASVAWDHYVDAQGGVFCGRNYRVRLATVAGEGRTAYGEPAPARPVGVEYFEVAKRFDAIGNWVDVLPRTVTVESKRFTWEIMRPASSAKAGYAARPVVGLDLGFKREHRAPWTCVNNCTGSGDVRHENGDSLPGYGDDGSGVRRTGGEKAGNRTAREHRKADAGRKNDGREIPSTGFAAH